jgi:CheY-like chemotaxis protein
MENMLKRLIGEDVVIQVDLDPSLGPIRGDHHQLEHVIMNLAVNARDAMPAGGRLSISTYTAHVDPARAAAHSRPPGRYSVLAVRDTGSGMSTETRTKIFEPFFTTKETGKGTGLGLPVVYGIVQQTGGFLTVQSELGVGSLFEVYIPCVLGDQARNSRRSEVGHSTKGTGRILLIEDDGPVRRLAELFLTQAGYSVTAFDEAATAMRLSASQIAEFDLLLTDMVMPGMSGPDIAGQLRQLRPQLKVVYVSGYTDHPWFYQGPLPHRTTFLQKPFTRDELLVKIESALVNKPAP